MEHDSYCNWDWVKVYDSDKSLMKKLCGYMTQDLVMYSTNNTMDVEFFSDYWVTSVGFLASWKAIDDRYTDFSFPL